MSSDRTHRDRPRVTRDQLEARLRQVRGDAEAVGESAKGAGTLLAPVAGAVVLAVVYLLGKRKGRRKSTVVEIRRV